MPTDDRGAVQHARWLAPAEGLALALLVALSATRRLPAGPVPWILALGWTSLRLRGLSFADVGFARGPGLRRLAYLGIVGGIALETFQLTVTGPLVVELLGTPTDLHGLARLEGDPRRLALGLVLAWALAACGGELAFRGYLLSRLIGAFARLRAPYSLALLLSSALSGLAHADRGPEGMVVASVAGVVLGATYLGCGRNLAVPIAVHGVVETIEVVLGYLGQLPGS